MCRGKPVCTLLGSDPSAWSRCAPLPPPPWFFESLQRFAEAVKLASRDALLASREQLALTRSAELRAFYVDHGQMSYRTRIVVLRGKGGPPVPLATEVDPERDIANFEAQVYERDGYLCRYCGIPVVPREVLALYGELVGSDVFGNDGTNAGRHGVVMAFRANADHVVPYNRGGRTDLDNLVTSCWSCNYGKNSYSVQELCLHDPRDRPVQELAGWQGLTEYGEPMQRLRDVMANEGRLPAKLPRAAKHHVVDSSVRFVGPGGTGVEGVLLQQSSDQVALSTVDGFRYLSAAWALAES